MNKEFIPYDQALELKELGFNEKCLAFYDVESNSLRKDKQFYKYSYNVLDEDVLAPLYQQAFRWFREKHGIIHCIGKNIHDYTFFIASKEHISEELNLKTYEEAELACIKKLIEIVKNK